jgi:hypothetical protein
MELVFFIWLLYVSNVMPLEYEILIFVVFQDNPEKY